MFKTVVSRIARHPALAGQAFYRKEEV